MGLYCRGIHNFIGKYYRHIKEVWRERKTFDLPKRESDEYAFLPAHLELIEKPVSALPKWVARAIVCFIIIALIWSIWGKVDVVAVASGKLSYSGRSKVIQPIERAIVDGIYVVEGQRVLKGENLVKLTTLGVEADYEKTKKSLSLALLTKLRAESLLAAIEEQKVPILKIPDNRDFDKVDIMQSQQLVSEQYQAFTSERKQAKLLLEQRLAEKETILFQIEKYRGLEKIERERFNDFNALYKKKIIAKHEFLEQESKFINLKNELASQQSKLVEIESSIKQAQESYDLLLYTFLRNIREGLRQANEQVEQLVFEEQKALQRQSTTTIKSPVTGTVQQLSIHTVGGVVTEAQQLMVIVPQEDKLEVTAFISNQDIGFVKVGQPVTIKIEAFPYTRYGYITGSVKSVSFDAIENDKLGLVFSTVISLDEDFLFIDNRKVKLTAGMKVSAEIKTGNRRVINYLLSPLQATLSESLRER
ncbi:HlyD family type I secretion periplasmic adaptor subunit [Avibacterium paragallinarum]|uniref:HlyD family type I secretion periplasmic adaptor subunit n=1 Tax=Avibacterium paragallinarum TaxID=728 RepID=UPI000F61E0C9|nr:HlyD family type I secretion periplasmic adaptor subunit [Avibacterium paragallinarum]AZI14557.1 HlyD family type I secretion periplasmic adaptor subunit [Avibacterium paragallinarum]